MISFYIHTPGNQYLSSFVSLPPQVSVILILSLLLCNNQLYINNEIPDTVWYVTQYVHWCKSGISVMGWTNHFLVGFKTFFTIWNQFLEALSGQGLVARQIIGPRGELASSIVDTILNWLLMSYSSTHRLVHLLTVIRDASICSQ